jgi:S-DNA-T family DNA segregation ATPase FtsK/SpoIIIE
MPFILVIVFGEMLEFVMEYAGRQISNTIEVDPEGYDSLAFNHSGRNPGKFVGYLDVLTGILILIAVAAAFTALATWSINDPSFSNANGNPAKNLLGFWGASFADIWIQFFGLGAAVSLFPPAIISWLKLSRQSIGQLRKRLFSWVLMTTFACAAMACVSIPESWPLPSSLGGIVGDMVLKIPTLLAGSEPTQWFAITLFFVFTIPAAVFALYSSGIKNRVSAGAGAPSEEEVSTEALEEEDQFPALGIFVHWYLSIKSKILRKYRTVNPETPDIEKHLGLFSRFKKIYRILTDPTDDGLDKFYNSDRNSRDIKNDKEGNLTQEVAVPEYGEQIYDAVNTDLAAEYHQPASSEFQNSNEAMPHSHSSIDDMSGSAAKRVQPMTQSPAQSARVVREAQSSLFDSNSFELPSLHFLGEPKKLDGKACLSAEELEQNARLLEGVLGDFGVKGEIINVRPGPVVTLYELEPAPGIKSSRVIGLADDIARSMSAIAARVAVVPGRNAIGIELPNQRRETVYLREVLASQVYERTKAKLPIILGKNIGGEPIIADLAKMPHLLVAGTTGSGKSVAINTMILSILYRLTPDQVKMIMIDPKMLELSVYDGIPHLLTPVVTDPKKAVVALKWTVREMEERYKSMSKLGVRNIDGYNSRIVQAAQKNETITKTVQTGFDRETGEAIYESEELDLKPMPYIVVIIDEMADLMMVAGKDIEGTVQRLAQMARAAGIHVVMATQRPSVDVITGTIKANFPTRISFQVTSKIDSRTILGEQGAEQLLGMGDMLYQAGGGKTSRVHGPFVEDDEVEKIVSHLKTQGTPQYLESVTAEFEEDAADAATDNSDNTEGMAESTDIYDQAVAIVLHDRKVSTSYIQRRLSIGYNRAATLIERMEQEGLISSANHAGKREILVPAEGETL